MNALKSSRRVVKPIVAALAFALSGTVAFAASVEDVVKTRPDQNIDQQYGRDSMYGFSADAKPLKPDQTGPRDSDALADAWHFAEGAAASAWAATTTFFHASDAIAQAEPEPYGRAGGYVGPDRIDVLSKTPTNSDVVVKTGEGTLGNVADTRAAIPDSSTTDLR